jgi:hypothetical protein
LLHLTADPKTQERICVGNNKQNDTGENQCKASLNAAFWGTVKNSPASAASRRRPRRHEVDPVKQVALVAGDQKRLRFSAINRHRPLYYSINSGTAKIHQFLFEGKMINFSFSLPLSLRYVML